MKQHWEKWVAKVEDLSLRERVMIFVAVAFLVISLINLLFFDPLLAKQKNLSEQMVQQQEKVKEIHAQLDALLQAGKNDPDSPLRAQLKTAQQRLRDAEAYLQNLRGRLVAPEKMADLLQQMLKKEGQLELVSLQSLPAAPLLGEKVDGANTAQAAAMGNQIYTHRVKITVRGSYQELLHYLTALEHLPTQMFWGTATMKVVQQPTAELTLTLYTLSLDKTWLQI